MCSKRHWVQARVIFGPAEAPVGAPADLVVLDETDADQIIVTHPEWLKVYKAGRLVAETGRRRTLHGVPRG
jgi:hypothetical protein